MAELKTTEMRSDSRRPQFGNRVLVDETDIFTHNAWDNVQWNEEQEQQAKKKVLENSDITLQQSEISKLEQNAFEQWDNFYSIHQNRFFKDRHWLFTEFPELSSKYCRPALIKKVNNSEEAVLCKAESDTAINENDTTINENDNLETFSEVSQKRSGEMRVGEKYVGENSVTRILEVGCGVGNTVFPILETNKDHDLFVYCSDFSETAIDILKLSNEYDTKRCLAFVYDLTSDDSSTPFPDESLDVIICIFVLSALQPKKMESAVKRLAKFLKPGGMLLFRDYGRYDMAQLRFKKGRCVGENFYIRGDGTFCYFFTQEDVKKLMESAGLKEIQNLVDRRLQVNRGKQLTMYRVWIQARYQKPFHQE